MDSVALAYSAAFSCDGPYQVGDETQTKLIRTGLRQLLKRLAASVDERAIQELTAMFVAKAQQLYARPTVEEVD